MTRQPFVRDINAKMFTSPHTLIQNSLVLKQKKHMPRLEIANGKEGHQHDQRYHLPRDSTEGGTGKGIHGDDVCYLSETSKKENCELQVASKKKCPGEHLLRFRRAMMWWVGMSMNRRNVWS
jgi:hypothetical protein